jgi:hypothetical protein
MTIEEHPRHPVDHEAPPGPWTRFKQAIISAAPIIDSRRVQFSGIVFLVVTIFSVVVVCSRFKSDSLSQSATGPSSGSSGAAQSIDTAQPYGAAQSTPHPVAKPSPFHRSQSPLPAQSVPVRRTANAAPVAVNDSAAVSAPVAPPAGSLATSLPFGVRMSASRDGFSNGCKHGRLIIEASSITFTCPDNPGKSVSVSVRQVRNLDDNGIVVFPRRKYHFDIAGKQKQAVHDLFAQWLENARRDSLVARN